MEAFSSAAFAAEVVTNACAMMGNSLNEYITSWGIKSMVEPVLVLQRAAAAATATGAASVLLGALDPMHNTLRIAKLGDVGFVVLRPPKEGSADDINQDLEVRLALPFAGTMYCTFSISIYAQLRLSHIQMDILMSSIMRQDKSLSPLFGQSRLSLIGVFG